MGGFFPMGGGGLGFAPISGMECVESMDVGLKLFFNAAMAAFGGRLAGNGVAILGGLGAAPEGGGGAELRDVSGSER